MIVDDVFNIYRMNFTFCRPAQLYLKTSATHTLQYFDEIARDGSILPPLHW